jgi:hypothetical protein
VPRGVPAAGRTSTWSVIVPGTTPVRSSGTTTSVQRTPVGLPHGATACALWPDVKRPAYCVVSRCRSDERSSRVETWLGIAPADATSTLTSATAIAEATHRLLVIRGVLGTRASRYLVW